MNLTELFETQSILDKKIIKEKGLQDTNLLGEKFLALLTELGELANEQRSWKFWSEDREPRNKLVRFLKPYGQEEWKNPLLEEYVDNLHFILSIGIDLGYRPDRITKYFSDTITKQFNSLFWMITKVEDDKYKSDYEMMFGYFLGLGEMLGFTNEQIKQAYYDKNKINHERQATGY